jgi:hypothetical protein
MYPNSTAVEQAMFVSQSEVDPTRAVKRLALFNDDGTPAVALTFSEIPTGADVLLTGYTTSAWSAVAASDTVNQAIAKVANFRVGSNIVLTGYALGANADVAASDTVNGAFGKVQKQIDDLVTALAALDARVVVLETA